MAVKGRSVPSSELSEFITGIPQAKVCRTCAHSSNRLWKTDPAEMVEHTNSGGKLDDLKCATSINDVAVEIRTGPPRRNLQEGARKHAEFSTCGQSILSKCRNCARFEPIRVRIPYIKGGTINYVRGTTPSGEPTYKPMGRRTVEVPGEGSYTEEVEPQWWNATVGGFCRLPAEGIIKDNRKVFCDPVEKKKTIANVACGNCEFLEWTDESVQFDGDVNKNARLNRYERFEIIQNTDPREVGRELGLALWRKQTQPQGRITWHRARLLETAEIKGRKWFTLQFTDGALKRIQVPDGHEWIEVYPAEELGMAAVMVRYPMHKKLGLNLPMRKKVKIWPALPKKDITLPSRPPILADPDCNACRPEKSSMTRIRGKLRIRIEHAIPCYFHAKAPYESTHTGDIIFKHVCSSSGTEKLSPIGILKVRKDPDGTWKAVDGNGSYPEAYGTRTANASVFRLWLPTLLEQAMRVGGEKAQADIKAQYARIVDELRYARKTIPMRASWLAMDTVEANKPYCAHPHGINFRKVWQDAFGSERVDRNFDEGDFNSTQVREEWRTGMRAHSLTPQRLQEEMLATEISHQWWDATKGVIDIPDALKKPEPETWTRVEIRGLGGMTDENGQPIDNVDDFMERLDSHVVVGHVDTAEGVSNERRITKRQQLFGYTTTRGRFGKRKGFDKTSMSSLDPDFVIFDYNPDDDEQFINDSWYCPDCGKQVDKVEDPADPWCDGCDTPLYRNHRSTGTHNPRVAGGIGVAIAPDSPRTQQQQRLWSQICPNWTLRNSTPPIGLDDIEGNDPDEPVMKQWHSKDEHRNNNLDFTVGQLTDEHRAANKVYLEALSKVEESREAHLREYPNTNVTELERLFPAPNLPFYKEKVAGSVSKMGGTASSE